MAERSLEIYRINLGKGYTFSRIVKEKWPDQPGEELTDVQAFTRLYQNLLAELVGEGVWRSAKYQKKGLAVMSVDPNERNGGRNVHNNILTSHANSFVIEGYVDAGLYNLKRKMADHANTLNRSEISRSKIITDSYYMYLYLPMNSGKGIFMIECKKGMSMSGVFTEFLSNVLGIRNICSCGTEMYMPHEIKTRYMEGCVLSSVTCSDYLVSAVNLNGNDGRTAYKVTVKVEPVNKPSIENRNTTVSSILQFGVQIGQRIFHLGDFDKKNGQMYNEGQDNIKTFDLDAPDVVPKYPLSDDMYDEENNILIRERIKAKCEELLPAIQHEVYDVIPINQE